MTVQVTHKDVYRPITRVQLTGGVGHTIVEKTGTSLLFRHGYFPMSGRAQVFEQKCDLVATKEDVLKYAQALLDFAKEL